MVSGALAVSTYQSGLTVSIQLAGAYGPVNPLTTAWAGLTEKPTTALPTAREAARVAKFEVFRNLVENV